MSSIQDWLLGLKEKQTSNLNWSATCSYYSLVHGGRLLCFLGLGDFPTSHKELRNFLAGSQPPRRRAGNSPYPFDWLRDFSRIGQTFNRGHRVPTQTERLGELRQVLVAYLETVEVPDARKRLDEFGQLFAAAGPLRNDSNYEALLIAHEYRHREMSNAFDNLSEHMASAAESTLRLITDTFNGFHQRDPDLRRDRDAYESFLHELVHRRIREGIRAKLIHTESLEMRLDEVLKRIGAESKDVPYDELEQEVSMSFFENKRGLMRDFEEKIQGLASVTKQQTRHVD